MSLSIAHPRQAGQLPYYTDLRYAASLDLPGSPVEAYANDATSSTIENVAAHMSHSARALVAVSLAELGVAPDHIAAVTHSATDLYEPMPGDCKYPIIGAVSEHLYPLARSRPSDLCHVVDDSARLAATALIMERFVGRFPLAPTQEDAFSEVAYAQVAPEREIVLSTFLPGVDRVLGMGLLLAHETAARGLATVTTSKLRLEAAIDSRRYAAEYLDIVLTSTAPTDAPSVVEVAYKHRRVEATRGHRVVCPTRFGGGELIQYFATALYEVAHETR